MTDTTTPEVSKEEHLQVVQALRQTLTNTAFQHYHALIQYLKSLPIPQAIPGMQHAYLSIDTGMLWIKDLLLTCPIILPPKEPTAGEVPCPAVQDNCVGENITFVSLIDQASEENPVNPARIFLFYHQELNFQPVGLIYSEIPAQ